MKLRLILNAVSCSLVLGFASTGAHALCPTDTFVSTDKAIDAQNARPGVLIMAHGGSEAWNQAVEQAIAPLKGTYPIEIAYGMAKTSTMHAAVERLEDQGVNTIAVVRMFISGSSFLDKTEYILGLRHSLEGDMHSKDMKGHGSKMSMSPMDRKMGDKMGDMDNNKSTNDKPQDVGGHSMEAPMPIDSDSTFILSTDGVSASTLVDDILIDRVRALSIDPSTESLLILAHGPGDDEENKQWLIDMQRRTERLNSLGNFIDIRCETLREDWPGQRAEAEKRIRAFVQSNNKAGNRVIVIPFRIAGFGPYSEVLDGLDYIADQRGFSPHPNITAWIDQTARELLPMLPARIN